MTDKQQQDFNKELNESKHFTAFYQWFRKTSLPDESFLSGSFNGQSGHLLSYLREERGIFIRWDRNTWNAATEQFEGYEFYIGTGFHDSDNFNAGLMTSILIAMNHE